LVVELSLSAISANHPSKQAERVSALIPQIGKNIRIANFIDNVRPGLTLSQVATLRLLKEARSGTLSMSQIAHELGVSLPTTSSLVDRLHREGLVARVVSERDRRVVLVRLTREGKTVVQRMLSLLTDLLTRLLAHLTEAEQESLAQAVERVFELSLAIREEDRRLAEEVAESAS
jgi:DNA-binding MarR family transcriptional regulator